MRTFEGKRQRRPRVMAAAGLIAGGARWSRLVAELRAHGAMWP